MTQDPVTSPCTKICALDESGAYCIGCFRTLDEIARWSELTDPQRREVLGRLEPRRRRFASGPLQTCPSCGVGFPCAAGDSKVACWCAGYPAVTPSAAQTACLCPACLCAARLARQRR